MIKNKLIGIVLFAVLISSIGSFSIAENIEDINESEIITISSVNQEEECGLCNVHVERGFDPKYMVKDYPHTEPVAVIRVWTEPECTGEEFTPDCGDDDTDDDDDPDPWVIPPLAAEQQSMEEREIKDIIFNNGEEEDEDCNICGNIVKQSLIGVQESITMVNEQVGQTSAPTPAPSSINMDSQEQSAEPVEAISISPAEPMETEPCDDPCWANAFIEDGAIVTFYPPENVFVHPESVGLGCGDERYVTVSVRTNAPDSGSIDIPYSASSLNSFEEPFISCSGMVMCGVGLAYGYGADDPNLPTITIGYNSIQEENGPILPKTISDEIHQITTGQSVIFDASELNNEGEKVEYSWEFGDGSVSEDKVTAEHTYEIPGEYTVKLLIEENYRVLDEGIANVVVVDDETNPVIDEEISDDEGTDTDDDDTFDEPDESDPEKDDFITLLDRIIQMLKDLFPRLLG